MVGKVNVLQHHLSSFVHAESLDVRGMTAWLTWVTLLVTTRTVAKGPLVEANYSTLLLFKVFIFVFIGTRCGKPQSPSCG